MTQYRLEVADVVRSYGSEYLAEHGDSVSSEQRRVLKAVSACRTVALGGHVEACDRCGHQRIAYNSCRNRHCTKCQAAARAAWMEERSAELLPVQYFHVVFALPDAFGSLALQTPRVVYAILFQAVAQTLLEVAADPKHLGARIGFLAILHTWGQNLMHHPHIHCLVPGGGLAADGSRWIRCRKDFFLPVRVLSRVFRGKFLDLLKQAYRRGALQRHARLGPLEHPIAFERFLNGTVKTDWVVHAKPPFGSPPQVLKYLARYTHRIAISNDRLISLEHGQFPLPLEGLRTRQYAQDDDARRHGVHPPLLAACFADRFREDSPLQLKTSLATARQLLGVAESPQCGETQREVAIPDALREDSLPPCPACKCGRMILVERLLPQRVLPLPIPTVVPWDSS